MKFEEVKKLFDEEVETRNNVEVLKRQFNKGDRSEKIINSLRYHINKLEYIKRQMKNVGNFCVVNLAELDNAFAYQGMKIKCTPTGIFSRYNFLGLHINEEKFTANVIYKGRYKSELTNFYYSSGVRDRALKNSQDVKINLFETLRRLSKNDDKFSKFVRNICFDLIKSKYFANDYNF